MGCLNEEEIEVVKAMERFGSSFVKALAECFHHADFINKDKLKKTFSAYWTQYLNASKNNK